MSENAPWPVGTIVAWYGPYDRRATGTVTIEKVYKTGHVIAQGRRFRMWRADEAHETGDGYSKASLRSLTDDRMAEIAITKKMVLARRVADWLGKAPPDDVPDDALRAMELAMSKSLDIADNNKATTSQ